ncbi:MAG: hypothetical protein AAGA23_08950 [Pseudomonadota bacterium]
MANTIATLVAEMQRRKVFRVTAAYAVVAFVVLQLGEITFDPLELPAWSLRALIVAVILGFPIVVVLAWVLEITPQGIRREKTGASTPRSQILLVIGVLLLDGVLAAYLYEVYAPGVMQDTPATRGVTAGLAPGLTASPIGNDAVAVLPFEDLSPEADQAYFADGVGEELANALTNVEGLQVVSGRATRALSDSERTPREIGALLRVAWLLEGSVRKEAQTLRVRVALTATATGISEWSRSFEGDLDNTLDIQDDIAREVVARLLGSADNLETDFEERRTIASFSAWEDYTAARLDWNRRTPESLARAEEKFKATLAKDPSYAPAYVGLADTYLLQASYGNRAVVEAVSLAEQNISQALDFDGQLSSAFATLGLLNRTLGRYPQAEAHLRRALTLEPENVEAANWLSGLLGDQGRLGEERLVLQQALEYHQFDELLNMAMADNQLRQGEVEAGMERLQTQLDIRPDSTLLLRFAAAWAASAGRHAQAHSLLIQADSLSPNEPLTLTQLGHLYMRWGELDRAEAAVSRAVELAPYNMEVEAAWSRFLLMSDRLEELEQYAAARLEGLSLIEKGATADSLRPLVWQAMVSLRRNDPAAAAERLATVVNRRDILVPYAALQLMTWQIFALTAAGDVEGAGDLRGEASRILDRLRLQGDESVFLDELDATLLAQTGDVEQGMALFEQTLPQGYTSAVELEQDLRLEALRSSPRFNELVDAVREQSRVDFASIAQQLASSP